MFDIGWQELFIVAVLALIVIGPKDLPRALRTMGRWVRKARTLAGDFRGGLDDAMREADLDDFKNEMESASGLDIGKEIENVIDPTGDLTGGLSGDLDMSDIETDLDTAAAQAAPGQAAPKKAPRKKAAPRKAAPRKAAPRKAAPRKAASASKAPAAKVAPPDPEDEAATPAKASG